MSRLLYLVVSTQLHLNNDTVRQKKLYFDIMKTSVISIWGKVVVTVLFLFFTLQACHCFNIPAGASQLTQEGSENHNQTEHGTSVPALESSLTILTHNDISKNKAFCVIKGACRVGDGSVVVPQWMRAYSAHISNCGIKKVSYHITEVRSKGKTLFEVRGMSKHISLKDDYRNFDVIGNEPPRGERDLLVNDLTRASLLLDILDRPLAYSQGTKSLCTTKNGEPCLAKNNTGVGSLKPLILVDSRISDTKDYMWPKSLLRLVRNSVSGNLEIADLKDVYAWKVYSEASCFRSLISTNVEISEIPKEVMTPKNIFFSKNNLNRVPLTAMSAQQGRSCSVKVLILNRYGKRYIEGSEKLSAAISAYGTRVHRGDERVLVQPEVAFFENSSFHEQVSVMQEAGVVVASHGDGNANFIFLRPASRVFEILPFGFASDVYRNISRAYGSIHSYVWSQPDDEVFSSCVKHFNPISSSERQAFLSHWRTSATRFAQETVRRSTNILNEYTVPEKDEDSSRGLKRLRQCASYQRISVDVRDLAKKVTKAAAELCHAKGDLSYLKT